MEPRSAASGRVHAIDLLRLLMSFQMIQGHTLGALLNDDARRGPLFDGWTFARGLTAVGFLLAAGASYHQVLQREDDPERARAGRARRLRRAAWLVAIGFLLRPPVGLVSGDTETALASLDAFFAVDVLQCIGATLVLLEALRRWVPPARLHLVCGVLAVALVTLAPWASAITAERPLSWIAGWLTRSTGSLFPLLPWAGLVLAGVALGPAMASTRTLWGAARLGALGVALIAGGLALGAVVPSLPPERYYAWPPFSMIRVGAVVVLAAVLGAASIRLERLPPALSALARQTLVLYVVHLWILHASVVGLVALLGPSLTLPQAIAVAAANLGISVAAALAWDRRERRS